MCACSIFRMKRFAIPGALPKLCAAELKKSSYQIQKWLPTVLSFAFQLSFSERLIIQMIFISLVCEIHLFTMGHFYA